MKTEFVAGDPHVVNEVPGQIPPTDETPDETPEGDMICIKRTPGRFVVCRKPLEVEKLAEGEALEAPDLPDTEYEEVEVDTFEQALKASLQLHRQHPLDDSEDAHMNAAFGGDAGSQGYL